MILSFINIRKVPREVLKPEGESLGFQHFPRDLANVNEWKIMFDPSKVTYLTKNRKNHTRSTAVERSAIFRLDYRGTLIEGTNMIFHSLTFARS